MPNSFSPWALVALLASCALVSSCASTSKAPATFAEAFSRAAGSPAEDLEIEVASRENGVYSSLEIWGDGIGIEDGKSQFQLEPAALRRAVRAFATIEDFADDGPAQTGAGPNGPTIQWKARIRIGRFERSALRLTKNAPLPELERLVEEVREACRAARAKGLRVKSLADGLSGVASGLLSPRALKVSFTALEETAGVEGGRPGTVLTLRGRSGEVSRSGPTGVLEARPFVLSTTEFSGLAAALRKAAPGTFPGALSSPRYEHLVVDVLGQQKDLQARRFADLDTRAVGESQRAYEELRSTLEGLASRGDARAEPQRR